MAQARSFGWLVASALAVSAMAGCAGASRSGPYSVKQVRHAFATEGFAPTLVFEASKVSQQDIQRLAPSTNPNPAMRQVAAFERSEFETLRKQRTSMLTFPSGSPDGEIAVVLAADPTGAENAAATIRRDQAREHARFEKQLRSSHTSGTWIPLALKRRGNILVIFPATVKPSVQRRAQLALAAI